MPKSHEWTKSKFEKFTKEGRGKGYGKNYKPWLTTQDVPSLGRRTRVLGWKTGRLHHFFSDHEIRYFYILDWADNVIDIREQFPLDLDIAQNIASDIGITYPTDKKSKFPYVLTTDFLITVNVGGKNKEIARTIKPSEELNRQRVVRNLNLNDDTGKLKT
jgi:hypothetical protein